MQRLGCLAVLMLAAPARAQLVGPSTQIVPYVLPRVSGVQTVSILTVGDSVGDYPLVGHPDGLGLIAGDDGRFTLLMNHEIRPGEGVVRSHGASGAFVSRWEIEADASNLVVSAGRDHNTAPQDANRWTPGGYASGGVAYDRFCSGDLAAASAYRFGALGTDARIYLTGEESGADGRAFAHIATGPATNTSWQLPRLGRFNWENAVASPTPQEKTIVVGTDDSTPGQVYLYVGQKTDSGSDIERAGLTNGGLFGVRVAGATTETRAAAASGPFDLHPLGNVSNTNGATLDNLSTLGGVTRFLRPEDGAWDPRPGHERDFYFVTTDALTSGGGRSRLYRLRFADILHPQQGGEITALLDGDEGHEMLDNLTIDARGRLLLQEDPGDAARLARIWLYDLDSGGFVEIARHNADFFRSGGASFLTASEESSGIIDAASALGDGWFLMDTMAHHPLGGSLVEGGQLMAMYVDPSIVPEPATLPMVSVVLGISATRRRAGPVRRSRSETGTAPAEAPECAGDRRTR